MNDRSPPPPPLDRPGDGVPAHADRPAAARDEPADGTTSDGDPNADLNADPNADQHVGADAASDKGTGFLAVLQSVAAAGIGVQSSKNRQRDFQHGKPLHFIIGGLIGTALFLLAVYLFVQVLLATA